MHACSYTVGGKKAARLPRLWTLNYFLVLLHLSWQLMITYQENNLFNHRHSTYVDQMSAETWWSTFCQWAYGEQPQIICSNLWFKGKSLSFWQLKTPPTSLSRPTLLKGQVKHIFFKKRIQSPYHQTPQQNGLKSLCKSARTLVIVKHWLTHDSTTVTLCYDKKQHNVGNMLWSWKFRILHLIDMFILYLKHGFIIRRKHKISGTTSHCKSLRAALFSAAVSPACVQLRCVLAAVYL